MSIPILKNNQGFIKIYTTIGIYRDGSYKINGVCEQNLKEHIEYNKTFRFGRALIVNGQIIHLGYWNQADLELLIKSKKLNEINISVDSSPYQ